MSEARRVRPPVPEKPKAPITFRYTGPDRVSRLMEVPGIYFDTAMPLLDIPFGLFEGGGGEIRVKEWFKRMTP